MEAYQKVLPLLGTEGGGGRWNGGPPSFLRCVKMETVLIDAAQVNLVVVQLQQVANVGALCAGLLLAGLFALGMK